MYKRQHLDRAAAQVEGPFAERPDQAELVERRRTQAVDQPPYVGKGLSMCLREAREDLGGLLRVGRHDAQGQFEAHPGGRERRPEPVVDVAPQPPPFLLQGGDRTFQRALQPGGEQQVVRGRADLPGEHVEQPGVAGAERLLARAGVEHQPADLLALVDERDFEGPPGRPPV